MSHLLKPLTVGELELPNRVIMAPLTRCRAVGRERIPNTLMRDYYVQRASAGMILTEATCISPMAIGYPDTPGIWSSEQVDGWRMITEAVHDAGGRILLQLWHVGRISDPVYLDGHLPVAPSAITPPGHMNLLRPIKPFVTPRALDSDEIPGIVETYRKGAENAKMAGFDGVEIHAANGYLIDQFLQDNTNHRTDRYGGSIENRSRFLLEIVDSLCTVWSPGRIGVHLAPRGDKQGMGDSDPASLFGHVARELRKRQLAFICARESLGENRLGPQIKAAFGGIYIANENFTQESAEAVLSREEADAIAFGRTFIANPDLPKRFALNAILNEPDINTFYQGGAAGYTDYPALPNHKPASQTHHEPASQTQNDCSNTDVKPHHATACP